MMVRPPLVRADREQDNAVAVRTAASQPDRATKQVTFGTAEQPVRRASARSNSDSPQRRVGLGSLTVQPRAAHSALEAQASRHTGAN
jgi:hypothetical protein